MYSWGSSVPIQIAVLDWFQDVPVLNAPAFWKPYEMMRKMFLLTSGICNVTSVNIVHMFMFFTLIDISGVLVIGKFLFVLLVKLEPKIVFTEIRRERKRWVTFWPNFGFVSSKECLLSCGDCILNLLRPIHEFDLQETEFVQLMPGKLFNPK